MALVGQEPKKELSGEQMGWGGEVVSNVKNVIGERGRDKPSLGVRSARLSVMCPRHYSKTSMLSPLSLHTVKGRVWIRIANGLT